MPPMTAREFADEIVAPTVQDFMATPDHRHGYLACLVSYHLGDYLGGTIRAAAAQALGLPFQALERMCNAAKHREATRGSSPPMQAGSDTERSVSGFDESVWEELRFEDRGGRNIEHAGRQYDMLDLCLIVVRQYADLAPSELHGSAIMRFHYNTRHYPAA